MTPRKMMIEFPAEISYKGRERCLTRKKSWLATYMFYDYDILELDYTKTAEEAIIRLSALLEKNEKIQ